jgi:O-6-methylguanine DNA methyltransferase
MDFKTAVYDVVRQIPKGKTLTYKEVAERAGSPRAYRAVGNVLTQNYDPSIPCHRVVRSDGTPGGYNRGADLKKNILDLELSPRIL